MRATVLSRMMKIAMMVILLAVSFGEIPGQAVALNTMGLNADTSAILDVSSTTQGMLIPRISQVARLSIASPPEGLWVFQTDANTGMYMYSDNAWVHLSHDVSDNVPVGGVLDWYPFGQPLPEGFAICDGSVVTDPDSPFFNETLPDLDEKFILGVALDEIDTTGGSENHSHQLNLAAQTTSSAPGHSHTASPASVQSDYNGGHTHSVTVTGSVSTESHTHPWVHITASENWYSYDANGTSVQMVNWTSDGAGPEGSGEYPVAIHSPGGTVNTIVYNTSADAHAHSSVSVSTTTHLNQGHNHSVSLVAVQSNTTSPHSHDVAAAVYGTTQSSSIPLYIRLLKIMRIK